MSKPNCQPPGTLVPLYSYDGAFEDHITIARARRLEQAGRVRVVAHRKGGVNRVIMLRREGDPRPFFLRDFQGEAYSFHQPLPDGHRPWRLRALQGGRNETLLAPPATKPIFLKVIAGCMASAQASSKRVAQPGSAGAS